MQKYADQTLGAVESTAQELGVVCELIRVEHEHPYRVIIDTAEFERLRPHRNRFARSSRHRRYRPPEMRRSRYSRIPSPVLVHG